MEINNLQTRLNEIFNLPIEIQSYHDRDFYFVSYMNIRIELQRFDKSQLEVLIDKINNQIKKSTPYTYLEKEKEKTEQKLKEAEAELEKCKIQRDAYKDIIQQKIKE